jgi:radical SAM protein with 4Fe4S-binding SPASM domain
MVWDVSFTCDICGKTKGEANHWWMASLGPHSAYEEDERALRFTLMRWHSSECRTPDIYHLCGQGCAMQAAERFMTEGAIDSEAQSVR